MRIDREDPVNEMSERNAWNKIIVLSIPIKRAES